MLHGKDLYLISNYKKLRPLVVKGLVQNCNWGNISIFGKLSVDFIEKFSNNLDWERLATNRELTEEIVLKYYNRLNLFFVFQYHQFKREFIMNNLGKFNKDLEVIINTQQSLSLIDKDKIKLMIKFMK